jgi:hypothetical protein
LFGQALTANLANSRCRKSIAAGVHPGRVANPLEIDHFTQLIRGTIALKVKQEFTAKDKAKAGQKQQPKPTPKGSKKAA